MKNLNFIALALVMLMNIGCAMESKSGTATAPVLDIPPDGSPYVPPGDGPGQNPGNKWGSTAPVTIDSSSVMNQFHRNILNDPQNINLNLNMVKTSGGTFGGTATITYTDGPYLYTTYFTAGNSAEATQYNRTFSYDGKTVWHAVFEDFAGGLVIVIDEIVDLGDGQGAQDLVSGTIWFKNFPPVTGPHPPTYCWFVYHKAGVYDCRPWPSGKGMNTYADKNPGAGYVKLGSFSDLSIKKAFNNQEL